MNRPWVRLSLVIIILVVVLSSGYRLLDSERQRRIEHDTASTYDTLAWTLTLAIADLRSAQRAYVANGQDPDEWYPQVAAQLGRLKGGLADLHGMSGTGEAVDAVAAADALVDRLVGVDESARNHTMVGQVLMASDLVFTDGQELTRQAAEQLDRARAVESEARAQRLSGRHRDDVITAAVAAVVAVGLAVVLLPLPGKPSREPEPTTAEHSRDAVDASVPADVVLVSAEWPINDQESADATGVPAVAADLQDSTLSREESVTPARVDLGEDSGGFFPRPVVPDLTTTAKLCTDLGQVSASHELSHLLSRAGDLLNASGLIVWVRDSSGCALRPAIGHGYAPHVLARLGPLACDGDSATATAYRTARLQVVSGGTHGPGAVAVPLVSSVADTGRCVGVLSAELQHGWETSDGVQATAMILAAQLATVVTADPIHAEHQVGDTAQAHG